MQVTNEILNPPGQDQLGLCIPLSHGINEKIKHVQKEFLAQDVQKLNQLYKRLTYIDKKYHDSIRKEINRIEQEMLNAGVDYTQTTMQMQTLKNENTVLFNRELNDELVQ